MKYLLIISLFISSCTTVHVGQQYKLCSTGSFTVVKVKHNRVYIKATNAVHNRKANTMIFPKREFIRMARKCND